MNTVDGGAALVRELASLRRAGKCGTLTVDAGSARTWISLESGVPVYAEGGARGDELGNVLRDEALIDDAQFRTIVQRVTEGFVDHETLRFGEVAVQLGYVDAAQVTVALTAQLERKLLECMRHRDVIFGFQEDPEVSKGLPTYPCDVEALVLSALGSVFDPPRVQSILGPHLLGYLRLEAPVPILVERLHANEQAARLLRAVDGMRPTAEVMGVTGMDPTDASQFVAALLLMGLATAPPEPSRAAMGREDTGRIALPAARRETAPAAIAESAAAEPAPRAPSPEAQARRARLVAARLGRLRKKPVVPAQQPTVPVAADRHAAAKARATAIAERFVRTHGSVPAGHRATTVRVDAELTPERDLKEAMELAFCGEHAHAGQMLSELEVATLGDAHNRVSFARRFCELQGLDEAQGKGVIGRGLDKEAKRLLRQDKHWAFGHFALGKLRLSDGDEEGAARSFKNAAALEPQNLHIQRYHRILQRRLKK